MAELYTGIYIFSSSITDFLLFVANIVGDFFFWNAFHPKRACLKNAHCSKITGVQGFCHIHRDRFFWLCRFLFLLQFHMQSMHQPHPCYLLKQSFWNPIWGQCRLNKISFWFGLPLWIGLLCLSRQNQQARKVCPVLHGWWCVLRLTDQAVLLGLRGTSTLLSLPFHSSFSFPFHLLPCRLSSTCRAEPWQTHTDCLLWHMFNSLRGCLHFFFTVFVGGGFSFFFSILVFVLFCSPCPHLPSLFLKVLNTKILT